jgi:acetyl-CoA carboxylase biotin carboxyl carrier protein
VDLKDIKIIIELMKKNSISEFELEKKEYKVKLKRTSSGELRTEGTYIPNYFPQPPHYLPQGSPAGANVTGTHQGNPDNAGDRSSGSGEKDSDYEEIVSPMIGTFYSAASPEAEPYVSEGTRVEPDTVVCIIEAMKVMNEIKAEKKGVIVRLVAENAKPVEFGQPLFEIRPE